MKLRIVPLDLAHANTLVSQLHRHHDPVIGHRFSIGCVSGRQIVGVAICSRPVARRLDDGWTLEVTRVATDGTANACSKLYGASWRIARQMGFCRLVTYTLPEEGGASPRGSGFTLDGSSLGRAWNDRDGYGRGNGARKNKVLGEKSRWLKTIGIVESYSPRELAFDAPQLVEHPGLFDVVS